MTYQQCRTQAIEDLKNYNYIKATLSTLPAQIEFLRQSGTSYASPIGQKVAGSRDSDSAFIAHISHIEQLQHTLEANTTRIHCMDAALCSLSEAERELLQAFYINRQRNCVNTLARKSYTDRSCIYRRAQRALEKYIFSYFGVSR